MLMQQLDAQMYNFSQTGGFREQLTAVRVEARAKKEDAPLCKKCGKLMTKRKAMNGKNAGKEFWGCTGYPECNGIMPI